MSTVADNLCSLFAWVTFLITSMVDALDPCLPLHHSVPFDTIVSTTPHHFRRASSTGAAGYGRHGVDGRLLVLGRHVLNGFHGFRAAIAGFRLPAREDLPAPSPRRDRANAGAEVVG